MHVRMKRRHEYDVPDRPGVRRTLPAGWAGELPDVIAEAAVEAGAAIASDVPAVDTPKVKKAKGGGKKVEQPETQPVALIGSDAFDAVVEAGGYKIQLGGLVASAHGTFAKGLKVGDDVVKAWNELDPADRDNRIQAIVDAVVADPGQVTVLIDEASIVGKPDLI